MDPRGTLISSRYKIEGDPIGTGGMANVYRATDIVTGASVALKMIKDDTMKDRVNLERFNREAQTTASLQHPNIVRVLNVGSYEGRPYIVNEFIQGKTLRQVLDQRGRLPIQEALDAMAQLCRAVLYAHRSGIIHRDIKPENIFLLPDGTIKLGDFGIATFMNASHITRTQNVVGSVHYMAPEVSQGFMATPQSDIYSMGITFFELITGRVPFDGDAPLSVAMKQASDRMPNIRKWNSECPEAVAQIIYRCCEKSPLDRYQSVYDLREDILRVKNNPDITSKKPTLWERIKGSFQSYRARRRRHS